MRSQLHEIDQKIAAGEYNTFEQKLVQTQLQMREAKRLLPTLTNKGSKINDYFEKILGFINIEDDLMYESVLTLQTHLSSLVSSSIEISPTYNKWMQPLRLIADLKAARIQLQLKRDEANVSPALKANINERLVELETLIKQYDEQLFKQHPLISPRFEAVEHWLAMKDDQAGAPSAKFVKKMVQAVAPPPSSSPLWNIKNSISQIFFTPKYRLEADKSISHLNRDEVQGFLKKESTPQLTARIEKDLVPALKALGVKKKFGRKGIKANHLEKFVESVNAFKWDEDSKNIGNASSRTLDEIENRLLGAKYSQLLKLDRAFKHLARVQQLAELDISQLGQLGLALNVDKYHPVQKKAGEKQEPKHKVIPGKLRNYIKDALNLKHFLFSQMTISQPDSAFGNMKAGHFALLKQMKQKVEEFNGLFQQIEARRQHLKEQAKLNPPAEAPVLVPAHRRVQVQPVPINDNKNEADSVIEYAKNNGVKTSLGAVTGGVALVKVASHWIVPIVASHAIAYASAAVFGAAVSALCVIKLGQMVERRRSLSTALSWISTSALRRSSTTVTEELKQEHEGPKLGQ